MTTNHAETEMPDVIYAFKVGIQQKWMGDESEIFKTVKYTRSSQPVSVPETDKAAALVKEPVRNIKGRSERLKAVSECKDRNDIARLLGKEIFGHDAYYPFLLDWVDGIQIAALQQPDVSKCVTCSENVLKKSDNVNVSDLVKCFLDAAIISNGEVIGVNVFKYLSAYENSLKMLSNHRSKEMK